jgi:hypothetical protein
MMKNRHPPASYLVPTTHLGDQALYTQNGSHAQSLREQLSASFSSFQFDVIFFGISEAVILVGNYNLYSANSVWYQKCANATNRLELMLTMQ